MVRSIEDGGINVVDGARSVVVFGVEDGGSTNFVTGVGD